MSRGGMLKANVVLVLILVPLALTARYMVEHPVEKERITSHASDWSALELQSINDLVVKRGDKSLRFQKNTDGAWIMTAPEFFLANQIKVNNIICNVMNPRVERRLELAGELQSALEGRATRIEVRFDQKLIAADFFSLPDNDKYDYIHYLKLPQLVYKVEREVAPDLSLIVKQYRTTSIFPFALGAVKSMTYLQGGHSLIFYSEGGLLKSKGAVDHDFWENAIKKWEQAGCRQYTSAPPGGEPEAVYEFTFASGDKARLALHVDAKTGIAVYYTGRKDGQVIDARTRDAYFPRL